MGAIVFEWLGIFREIFLSAYHTTATTTATATVSSTTGRSLVAIHYYHFCYVLLPTTTTAVVLNIVQVKVMNIQYILINTAVNLNFRLFRC